MAAELTWMGQLLGLTQIQASATFTDWGTPDSPTNFLILPSRLLFGPRATVNGVLQHTEGTVDTDLTRRPRASAVVGPGATLRGLATKLRPYFLLPSASAALSVDEIARALAVYGKNHLPLATMARYQVGLHIPLPLEEDAVTDAWVINTGLMHDWASQFPPALEPNLDRRPSLLPLPDAAALPGEALDLVHQHPSASSLAKALADKALINAFEAVFFAFELMRQPAADPPQLGIAFIERLLDHQAELLASLAAGNALLRRVEQVLPALPPSDAVREKLARALRPGGQARPFTDVPETEQQLTSRKGAVDGSAEPVGGLHRMVAGRSVAIGGNNTFGGFFGPSYNGRLDPVAFRQANQTLINPTNDPRLEARLLVVSKVAATEGKLDSIRMRDAGIISPGMQQWTIKENDELVPLLAQLKAVAPDEFLLYFQTYGLDVRSNGQGFELWSDLPNAVKVLPPGDRVAFFGGKKQGSTTKFSGRSATAWAARFRLAALTSLSYKAVQWRYAASRFDKIVARVGSQLKIKGVAKTLGQTFNSEFAAAIILDSHINAPAYVVSDLIKSAAAHAALYSDDPAKNGPFVTKAVEHYDQIRRFGKELSADKVKERKEKVRGMGFSKDAGSFTGW